MKLNFCLVPADPEDSKNCILEIRAGTGGDEASIFAGDIFRMYSKFCERKGWRLEVTNISEGTSGGFKEVVATITGENVYGVMKYESGFTGCSGYHKPKHRDEFTHRLQQLQFCLKLKNSTSI